MNLKFLLSVGAAAGLTACASIPDQSFTTSPTTADLHAITVAETGNRLDISAPAGAHALGPDAVAQVESFASEYARIGHGPVVLSVPSGNANADSAARLAQEIRMRLSSNGVAYGAIAGSVYDASEAPNAPIVLSFTRYAATAPQCEPIWSQQLGPQSNNQSWDSFGCATQANLAAMIEDPHDLIEPREETARDSTRRGTVMEAYRAGTQTHATRSGDERITVSNIAR
jgi:pilus assembly protein CpaD